MTVVCLSVHINIDDVTMSICNAKKK